MQLKAQTLALVSSLVAAANAAVNPALLNRAPHNDIEKRAVNARMSWYDTETGNPGSCGQFIQNSQFAVALSEATINRATDCFRTIRITLLGQTADAVIMDTCPGCTPDGLDLSRGLAAHFGMIDIGIAFGDWVFVDGNGAPPAPAPAPVPAPAPAPVDFNQGQQNHEHQPQAQAQPQFQSHEHQPQVEAFSHEHQHQPAAAPAPTPVPAPAPAPQFQAVPAHEQNASHIEKIKTGKCKRDHARRGLHARSL